MRALLFLIIIVSFLSCSSEKTNNDQAFLNSLDSAKQKTGVDEEVINSILDQIPSPLEISSSLKSSGSKFEGAILNPSDNLPKYNSNYKKALNLGIYGTDLGYTNIYEQNQQAYKYISAVKSLADDLNIGQFFDIQTIARLAANSSNLDSLLLMTTQNFNSINHYLQTQGRDNMSVLLLTGGWIEAMHITCHAASTKPNEQLYETIGGQKIILEQLMLLFSFYQDDSNMTALHADLEQLKAAFEKVKIEYIYKESTMEIVNGVAVIKDNSTTTVLITPENVAEIKGIVDSIRGKIIG